MSKTFRFGLVALPLWISLFLNSALGQETPSPAQPPAQQQPGQPASPQPGQPAPSGPSISPTTTVVPSGPPPPKEPYVLPDGGFYIEPLYWLSSAQPRVRGGLQAANIGDFQYNGKSKRPLGGEIGIPAGRSNTLRISYFRVQGNAGVTLAQDALIFSESYSAGDFINATYKLQAAKVSWDYLSYTWHKPKAAIRVKTLYEVQYVTTTFEFAAPTTILTVSGDTGLANGGKSIILPTFGMALEGEMGKYFRWDVRGSGFGIPGRSVIGDVQGTLTISLGRVEVVGGERLYYFKTSPRTDMYASDMLQGVFGGLRFVWRGNR